jgi:F-type H+-transporting ATPase subunit b
MLVDWFTVAAQAVNFIVLMALMKRFLYRPILGALDARERRITAELADARAAAAAARAEREAYEARRAALEAEREALLHAATAEAARERARLLHAAQLEVTSFRAAREAAVARELSERRTALAQRTRDEVFALARRVLADLAGATLEGQLVEAFAAHLAALPAAERAALAAVLGCEGAPAPVVAEVRTAFPLEPIQAERVRAALAPLLPAGAAVRFSHEPGLLSGLECTVAGHRIAWSVADYLAELERAVDAALAAEVAG